MLWAYWTMQWIPTGVTLFDLAFGTETIILLKIDLPSLIVERYSKENNSDNLQVNLDLLDETREHASFGWQPINKRQLDITTQGSE